MIPHVLVDPYRVEVDPFWSNVILLVTADGVSTGSAPTDKSALSRSASYSSGVTVVDTNGKFNSRSFKADSANSSYIRFGASGDAQKVLLTSCTYEYWFAGASPLDTTDMFFFFQTGASGSNFLRLIDNDTLGWSFALGGTSGGGSQDCGALGLTWHHMAVVRKYDPTPALCEIRLYLDGGLLRTNSGWGTGSWDANDGVRLCGNGNFSCQGFIDQFRITKGVERYTGSSYDVPTKPFPRSGP